MNKKGYNKARKNHYNVKVIKGEQAKHITEKAEAEAKAKAEVIKTKNDLFNAEKARLENELEYERKYLNAKRNKPYYMASVAEDIAKRYASIEVKTEAIQRINAEAEAEAEVKKAISRYETCSAWLAEAEAEKQYKPIDGSLWSFCRKQKTREALAIMEYTENGLRKNKLEYEDYKQTCYLTLFEYSIENPNAEFGKALFACMKKGIYAEWKKTHSLTRDKDGNVIERVINSLENPINASEPENGSLKDALPDTLAKPLDYDIIQDEACERIYDLCKGSEAVYISDLADGYTVKEIAYFNGTNYDTIQKQIYRAKKRISKELHAEAEAKAKAREAEKAEAEAKAKASEPCEPNYYHDMSHVVPFIKDIKPFEVPNTCEAFKAMINKPLVYASVTDTSKRSKRTYVKAKDGSTENRIKAEAEVKHIVVKAPISKAKYSEYDNDALKARIHKAEVKKAECELWELENASYCKKLYANI